MRRLLLSLVLLAACATTGVAKPKQGEACDENGRCAKGLTCVKYFGVAGARGPQMTSCELRCKGKKKACPTGQSCTTIADGPGQVCRPTPPKKTDESPEKSE